MLLWLISCAPDGAPPAGTPAPAPAPWHWIGADDRAVIHRGVNLNNAAKNTGYDHGLTPEELALLPANGITLVRFLVFWEAIEPTDGALDGVAYDDAYLARVREQVIELSGLGLEVVLDLHQDVYGQGFGFTGFPRWTCSEEAYADFELNTESWFLNYLDPNVVGCFDAFWASAELQGRYAAMAARLVEEVADLDAVVGLDVINEPYWGTLDPAEHDEQVLPAFYAEVLHQVRAVHPTLRLWLAPSVAANITGEPLLDLSGLGDPYLGVAPHFYPHYAELGTGWDGTFDEESRVLGDLLEHAEAQEVPLFLGEYGIFSAFGNEDDYVRAVMAVIEGAGGSSAWWSYDRGSGVLESDGGPGWLLPVYAEPWPHRIPGRLEGWVDGTLSFSLAGAGEVEWVAPEGCAVAVEGGAAVGERWSEGRLVVSVEAEGLVEMRLDCG